MNNCKICKFREELRTAPSGIEALEHFKEDKEELSYAFKRIKKELVNHKHE